MNQRRGTLSIKPLIWIRLLFFAIVSISIHVCGCSSADIQKLIEGHSDNDILARGYYFFTANKSGPGAAYYGNVKLFDGVKYGSAKVSFEGGVANHFQGGISVQLDGPYNTKEDAEDKLSEMIKHQKWVRQIDPIWVDD